VPREKPKIAAALAEAGEMLGNRFIVTDVGSNPALQLLWSRTARDDKGCKRSGKCAIHCCWRHTNEDLLRQTLKAGADIVQIGTAIEQSDNAMKKTELFAKV